MATELTVSDTQNDAAANAQRSILSDFRQKTGKSAAQFARSSRVLASGTTGNLRHFSPYPLYFVSASGSEMVDLDGSRLIDCFLCNGPMLLGHRHPQVLAALREHEGMGSLLVNPPLATELAELLQRIVPGAERVRFLNSGTEALLTAVRLARAFTRKNKIIKFYGHYHGQDDQFLVGIGAASKPFSAGVPAESYANTILVKYGDIAAISEVLDRESDVAAVLLDPAMHSGGLWGSSPSYLKQLRDLTLTHRVVLIIDEVITGFRLGVSGAQGLYGVTGDLTTLAKALAVGEKLAAVVGREEIMRGLDAARPAGTPGVFQSGTGNDGTSALAASLAALRTYEQESKHGGYTTLFGHGDRLARGIRAAFHERGLPCHVNQLGPMLQLFLTDQPPSFEAFSVLPTGPVELFYLAMINQGILLSLPTSNHIYLSFAHSTADIDRIIAAVHTVLDSYDFAAVISAGNSVS
jgi:glutamate-1-semialdehyde 2,1-aminomutase